MTAREILRYVGCTLGPVVPDTIFAGTKCPVMADCRLSFRSLGWLLSVSELNERPQTRVRK